MGKIDLNTAYTPSERVVARFIEDDLVIVPIESAPEDDHGSLYSITGTGREIWKRLNADTTVNELCHALSEEYDATPETIKTETLSLLEDLFDKGLIVKTG